LSGQLHATIALPPEEKFPVATKQEAVRAPE